MHSKLSFICFCCTCWRVQNGICLFGYNYSIMKRLVRSRKFHILFFESLGSLILIYGACSSGLHVAPDVIVAASFFLAVSLTGEVTGGYINPLITLGTYVEHRHNKLKLYLLAQLLGAFLGGLWSWALLGNIEPQYKEGWDSIEPVKFIINELLGSTIFTVCVLALTNRYTSHAVKAWQVYLSIPVALFLVRKLTGDTVLNPAAGISLQLIAAYIKGDWMIFVRDVWPLVVPSVIGGILGGYFTLKFYEPLLLYIKYKDLAEDRSDEEDEEEEEEANERIKKSTMIED